jgi:putative SOS response-associated peptidase YedK
MPGRFFLTRPMTEVAAWYSWSGPLPNDPPRRNIAPGQEVVLFDKDGLTRARWGMIPVGRVNARGRPVMETIVNARSETVLDKSAFVGVGRAVVPADGWYEWTGTTGRKQPWQIERADGGLIGFAAITDRWTAPGGQVVRQVAMLTCPPSGDVSAVHDRMGVILQADQIDLWLGGGDAEVKPLFTPLADGSLVLGKVLGVDWSGP